MQNIFDILKSSVAETSPEAIEHLIKCAYMVWRIDSALW